MALGRGCFLLLFLVGTAQAQTHPAASPPAGTSRPATGQPGGQGVHKPAQAPPTEEFEVSYDGSLTRKRLAEIAAEEKAGQPGQPKAAGRKRAAPAAPPRGQAAPKRR